MSQQVRLRLLPSFRCLFDEPVQLKVSGLRSRQVVSMRARSTDEKGEVFSSSATYVADNNGEIDLNTDPSFSGSYVGIQPMGLLSSLKPDNMHKRFNKDKSVEPFMVNFSVNEDNRILAEATNERFLMADGAKRVPVKEGNMIGVLFIPPGKGPFPAVFDLTSVEDEKRPSLLANKGYVVLTVPVFTGKTDIDTKIHLDPFAEAVHFLLRLPQVGSKGVGIISGSKSADIALSLSAFVPGVDAVIWINGCSANTAYPLYYKKKPILPALSFDAKQMIALKSGVVISKLALDDPLKEENRASLIPIEKSNCRFLFVASEDDLSWNSKAYMEQMVERLKHHGKNNFQCQSYPGAGHILRPPYGPHCPSSLQIIARQPVLWGGEPRSHSAAEVHMWEKVQEFFRTHLSF